LHETSLAENPLVHVLILKSMKRIYTSAKQIDFTLSDLPNMPAPSNVLMVKPTYFDVEYIINPHMKGHIGRVDKMKATSEWQQLRDGFRELGLTVHTLNGEKGLPDMVFCANQSLPFYDENGNKKALMSTMHAPQRKGEVAIIEKWYREQGYETLHLNPDLTETFEGMGDALWHPERKLLWGAYGFRTSENAYEQISEMFNCPVTALELVDEKFYHLDTCMCMLSESSVLIYPGAFADEGLEMIHSLFENVITTTKYEAEKLFAVNATCPDGKNVMIQKGCTDTNKKLRHAGFAVHEYSTGEFLKSGGSVFCMKLLFW
jgi:N-dimethylarginine dimethylaminohydrolase